MEYDMSPVELPPSQPLAPAPPPEPALPAPAGPSPLFPRLPGETPRAFSAFLAFFELGHSRSLSALADKLGEGLGTVKNWSSRYDWSARLQAFNSGLLQTRARDQAADWNRRLDLYREQEWEAAQKLIAAAQCFLETFGEEDLRRMTLAQVSRALKISSTLARSALAGAGLSEPSVPEVSPLQQQLLAGVSRVYGQPAPAASASTPTPAPTCNP